MAKKRAFNSELSDEDLVYKYKRSSIPKERWRISERLFEKYKGIIIDELRKKFPDVGEPTFQDLLHDIKMKIIEKDVIGKWDPDGGLSVKNWLMKYYIEYLPSKTKTYGIITESRSMPPRKNILSDPEREVMLDEFERMGKEFIKKVLKDPNSIFAHQRKKKRREVLEVLYKNFKEVKNVIDREKAKEVSMTPSSFKSRKQRALDDLVDELGRQGKRVELLWYAETRFNYRHDAITARIEEKAEDSKDGPPYPG